MRSYLGLFEGFDLLFCDFLGFASYVAPFCAEARAFFWWVCPCVLFGSNEFYGFLVSFLYCFSAEFLMLGFPGMFRPGVSNPAAVLFHSSSLSGTWFWKQREHLPQRRKTKLRHANQHPPRGVFWWFLSIQKPPKSTPWRV